MALLKYFKHVEAEYPGSKLPDPQGVLSKEVPPSIISAANVEVS